MRRQTGRVEPVNTRGGAHGSGIRGRCPGGILAGRSACLSAETRRQFIVDLHFDDPLVDYSTVANAASDHSAVW